MKAQPFLSVGALAMFAGALVGCGDSVVTPSLDAGLGVDAVSVADASTSVVRDVETRADGRVIGGPFATRVVSFTAGAGANFGHAYLPDVVLGPPVGSGDQRGGTDVVSLGLGGEIVLSIEGGIVDGPGDDFIVFENAFVVMGVEGRTWDELGEVSVSEDGERWVTFPCDPHGARPHTGCAGWNPVYSNPVNGLPPSDPRVSGGDVFDLATVHVSSASFVRIRDLATQGPMPPSSGFDLDAVGVIHSR